MTRQHDKLFSMLSFIVANLRHPRVLRGELLALGRRHAGPPDSGAPMLARLTRGRRTSTS
jgi:hypothetical protein